MHNSEPAIVRPLGIDLAQIPALLDAEGIRKIFGPISRTMLYELATRGEIETASIGLGRGRRVFVAASIVSWLERRMAQTKRPNIAPRTTRATAGSASFESKKANG